MAFHDFSRKMTKTILSFPVRPSCDKTPAPAWSKDIIRDQIQAVLLRPATTHSRARAAIFAVKQGLSR
jgi:hypothetical protein